MYIPKINNSIHLCASLAMPNVRTFYIDYIMSYGGYGTVLSLFWKLQDIKGFSLRKKQDSHKHITTRQKESPVRFKPSKPSGDFT
jgi:hypothetical protein